MLETVLIRERDLGTPEVKNEIPADSARLSAVCTGGAAMKRYRGGDGDSGIAAYACGPG